VGLHYPEFQSYLPAAIVLTALAVVALVLRVRTGALGPAISTHLGYNLALVALRLLVRTA
jgi:membrane protease YdiL (CAAX protease family)